MAKANDVLLRPIFIGAPHDHPEAPFIVMVPLRPPTVASPPAIYFDDTGCNANASPTFMWAGYIAPRMFWVRFGRAWNRLLARAPRIPYWHQTDMRNRCRRQRPGKFHHYSDLEVACREALLCKLLHTNRSRFSAFAIKIDHADLAAHVTNKIRTAQCWNEHERDVIRPKMLESPRLIALLHAAKIVAEILPKEADSRMPVSIHCEAVKDDPFQDYMQRIWKVVCDHEIELARKRGESPPLGSLSFPPGKTTEAPQLQAADMLAWHLNFRAVHPSAADDPNWEFVTGLGLSEFKVSVDQLQDHVRLWSRVRLKPPERRLWYPS